MTTPANSEPDAQPSGTSRLSPLAEADIMVLTDREAEDHAEHVRGESRQVHPATKD